MKDTLIFFLIFLLSLSNIIQLEKINTIKANERDIDARLTALEQNLELEVSGEVLKLKNSMDDVRITYYEPVAEQCWGDPLVTANGSRIDTVALRNKEIHWCAVSRDIEEDFPMGSEIEIFISEGHRWNGIWKIMDRTSARLTNTIDILSNTDKGGCYKGTIKEL